MSPGRPKSLGAPGMPPWAATREAAADTANTSENRIIEVACVPWTSGSSVASVVVDFN